MNKENNIKAMKEWIVTYFDEIVEPKIANLEKMIGRGFVEEALTLALCYIDAIANFDRPKRGDRKTTFINTLYDYSDFRDSFSKVSRIFIVRKGRNPSEKDTKSGTSLSNCEKIKEVLLKKYGRNNNHSQEMDKDGVIQHLKQELNTCDWSNLETNLDKFSYAAVLYERCRSAGVHEMGFEADLINGKTLFEQNDKGEDVYYSGDLLCFSKEIILKTLKNIHKNLRKKCLDDAKWPCEIVK